MSKELKTHYAIVGAGIAGITAAEAIREVDSKRELLLINGEKVAPYCRPLIIELLKGERAFDEVHLRGQNWFEEKNISIITGDPAVRLDAERKRLLLESGSTVEWKKLLIAVGSKPAMPRINGIEDVPAFTLYRQDDIEHIKPRCKPGAKALLIGIGLIGLQAMTSLRELEVDVVAIELKRKVLPLILDEKAAKYAKQKLEQNGIEIHLGTSVKKVWSVNGTGHPYAALTSGGDEIAFDFLVTTTGMKPDFSLINGSTIETNRGIKVSPDMQTSVSDVFAAGDVTQYPNWIEGRVEIHAHWVNAYRQGRIAGLRMAGKISAPYDPVYINSLNVFGLPIITMGASRIDKPKDAEVYVSNAPARPAYRRFVVKGGRLVAATFLNDTNRAGVFQYLMREKVDIGNIAEALFDQKLEGMEFLYKYHDEVIQGNVDWPASMDLIDKYKKDHSHTRWGKVKKRKKS
ncbi:MAG: FAD-dependent oxidoreductase [Candidatus Latescibacteria bacterium]|nr:FAD-dependent oxidoreductase [Candidatus Latescibacterota bacterium]NIO28382.1 FAD-dependent oxidoreductase [Candidatus Latescibacterota bacterium]NIO55931.1 FAD-dependent oxidoreductase [Candidatus Latescibacterota bacterium]NIT01895.1 FAD-dependent oxidoreductase [Candidatus Latescibacterota bacterium]